jgi:homoserine dehydrogenase
MDAERTTPPLSQRPQANAPIGIGLLGCGTVGGGVLQLLAQNARYLGERVGVPLVVRRVLVRDLEKERVPECDRALLTLDADSVIDDPAIDLIVEVMGGEERAGALVERALKAGKSVVTANKMLLALRGPALLDLAHDKGVDLAFEGAVGGGIPIIRTLRDAFASDWVTSLTAIINGTCNYVLTRMRDAGLPIGQAIKEAQEKGYGGGSDARRRRPRRGPQARRARDARLWREGRSRGRFGRRHPRDRRGGSSLRRALRLRHQAPRDRT